MHVQEVVQESKFLPHKNTQAAARNNNVLFLRFTSKNIRNTFKKLEVSPNCKKPQEVMNFVFVTNTEKSPSII